MFTPTINFPDSCIFAKPELPRSCSVRRRPLHDRQSIYFVGADIYVNRDYINAALKRRSEFLYRSPRGFGLIRARHRRFRWTLRPFDLSYNKRLS